MKNKWMVIYQTHDKNEYFGVSCEYVTADTMGEALRKIDEWLSDLMEKEHWSDYNITNINVIPELH